MTLVEGYSASLYIGVSFDVAEKDLTANMKNDLSSHISIVTVVVRHQKF